MELDNINFGGFNKEKPQEPLKGTANEKITGFMPIYICKENWQIAKHMIKLALGWTITMDTNGFDP